MLVFHRLRRRHQPYRPRSKNWLAILHPKRFQQKQRVAKLRRDFSEGQFAIELQLRFEVGRSEPGASIAIEMLAQSLHVGAGQRKANCVRVSAIARKQVVTRFDRVQQMERRD